MDSSSQAVTSRSSVRWKSSELTFPPCLVSPSVSNISPNQTIQNLLWLNSNALQLNCFAYKLHARYTTLLRWALRESQKRGGWDTSINRRINNYPNRGSYPRTNPLEPSLMQPFLVLQVHCNNLQLEEQIWRAQVFTILQQRERERGRIT